MICHVFRQVRESAAILLEEKMQLKKTRQHHGRRFVFPARSATFPIFATSR